MGEIENAFAGLLIQTQEYGELDEAKDPQRLARFLQMQLMGLLPMLAQMIAMHRFTNLLMMLLLTYAIPITKNYSKKTP